MKRREFAAAAAGTAALSIGPIETKAGRFEKAEGNAILHSEMGTRFKLKYAPHEGHFRHHAGNDYLDQLEFAAEVGFTAWEDSGMMGRPWDLQEKAARLMAERGITMGAFIGYASFVDATFANPSAESRRMLKDRMGLIIECAKRVNAKWTAIVPGTTADGLEWDRQSANVIETLKMCAEILEPEGIVMVLKRLTPSGHHADCFLSRVPQAFRLCEAVGSRSCKILGEVRRPQIAGENLMPNLDKAWSEIAYIQAGDSPGHHEEETGEINFRDVFEHLYKIDFQGVIGMEHGLSRQGREGELALIQAYRAADNF